SVTSVTLRCNPFRLVSPASSISPASVTRVTPRFSPNGTSGLGCIGSTPAFHERNLNAGKSPLLPGCMETKCRSPYEATRIQPTVAPAFCQAATSSAGSSLFPCLWGADALPVATSHNLIVLSLVPEASVLPSGVNATDDTDSSWVMRLRGVGKAGDF